MRAVRCIAQGVGIISLLAAMAFTMVWAACRTIDVPV